MNNKTVNLPASSIHPFLWNETRTESGTTRSLGVRTPLKITLGGSFLPSAATANVTVKLLFSAPQDFTGTVQLPLNFQSMAGGHLEPHWCLIHIENSGQKVSMALASCDHEPVEFYCLFFEIIWQTLGEGGLRSESDGMAQLPVYVPAYRCFECGIIAEFFRL